MYRQDKIQIIEDVCYQQEHREKVISLLNKAIPDYFDKFIYYDAGNAVSKYDINEILKKIQSIKNKTVEPVKPSERIRNKLTSAISDFEHDRKVYETIFDKEALEKYKDDEDFFKRRLSRVKNPLVRSLVNNKFSSKYNKQKTKNLIEILTNIYSGTEAYIKSIQEKLNVSKNNYDGKQNTPKASLALNYFSSSPCAIAYDVKIDYIKTHVLYKYDPALFPNKSKAALWALWYLTGKKAIGLCQQDSEFSRINMKNSYTITNDYYPYGLFSYYSYYIFQMMCQEAKKRKLVIGSKHKYRYVFVDAFLSFIADYHATEISFLKHKHRDPFDYRFY